MSKEIIFVDGVFVKRPPEGAPDFVKLLFSVNVDVFKQFLDGHRNELGYVNLKLKVSKSGKPYLELDTFTPKPKVDSTPVKDFPF